MIEQIWKYLVGPIVADAQNVESLAWKGATAYPGYNPVNTVLYGLTALLSLYVLYRFFQKKDLKLDSSTALHSLPFMFLGGTLRFLEDASAVPFPYNIVLITPLIYFLIAGVYLPALTFLEDRQLSTLGSVLAAPTLLYAFLSMPSFNTFYFSTVIFLTAFLVLMYHLIVDERFGTLPYLAVAGSQFFGGTASMLANVFYNGYTPKQLLTAMFYNVFGPTGILLLKFGIVGLAVYVLKDLEEEMFYVALMVLYAVGFATGFRVLLRAAAGI